MTSLGKNDKEVATVKKFKTLITGFINTRLGFYNYSTLLLLDKDSVGISYRLFTRFGKYIPSLSNNYQSNPTSFLLLGVALYVKNTRAFYICSWVVYIILNILLISNSIYYREFSDFITVSAMLASSKVSAGLGDSALNLLRIWDIIYILDFIILISLSITKKSK